MESSWTIETNDGHKLYGVLSSEQPADSAVFMVHGLASTIQDYALKRAADFFAPQYDVYRFELYSGNEGGRSLVDCTLQTHAADLGRVLAEFAPRYDKIFLIGHSYGGPTIMIANADVTAVSLWDPSFDLKKTTEEFARYYKKIDQGYLIDYGIATLIGDAMYRESVRYDAAACAGLAKAFKSPLQVIHAGGGTLIKRGKSYHTDCPQKTDYRIVDKAGHCFVENDTCDELLNRTDAWFGGF